MAIATGTLIVNKEDRYTLDQFAFIKQTLIDRISISSDIKAVRTINLTSFEVDIEFIIEPPQ
jgi:hypothetical protein